MELTDHLFRHEAGRMVAVLTRLFGVHNLALAEDVVQDAFCRALEVWAFRGVPENPSAWLMAAAKNRALDVLRRERTVRTYERELSRFLESEWTLAPVLQEMFAENSIKDDQLRVMFSCCHPRLPEEAQVMLILHILCGFGVDEVASAFVTTYTAVEKRIPRAKKVLAGSKRLFDTQSPCEFSMRLPAVQRALYLLFNEGYHGASAEFAVRADLCQEAMRLAALLLNHPLGATPPTYALSALMCLNRARLPARLDASGKLNSLFDQDRSLWDHNVVSEGLHLLDLSAKGSELSEYHVEAAIAAVHATAPSVQSTDWEEIVSLYDTLMTMRPTPIVALNRAIAVGQRDGPQLGLKGLREIQHSERLAKYPFYHAAFGEFELQTGRPQFAHQHFSTALGLSRNPQERHFFRQRVEACAVSAEIRKHNDEHSSAIRPK
jgi:RNA polymerase sigma factor (sigma-70 family)